MYLFLVNLSYWSNMDPIIVETPLVWVERHIYCPVCSEGGALPVPESELRYARDQRFPGQIALMHVYKCHVCKQEFALNETYPHRDSRPA